MSTSRTTTIRRWSWDPNTNVTLTLVSAEGYPAAATVFLDGSPIGEVESYEGSLDRHAGRIRIPGKRRTLWLARRPLSAGPGRSSFDFVSRADAIRSLLAVSGRSDA